jgi:hypothetical protein
VKQSVSYYAASVFCPSIKEKRRGKIAEIYVILDMCENLLLRIITMPRLFRGCGTGVVAVEMHAVLVVVVVMGVAMVMVGGGELSMQRGSCEC